LRRGAVPLLAPPPESARMAWVFPQRRQASSCAADVGCRIADGRVCVYKHECEAETANPATVHERVSTSIYNI